MDNWLRIPEGYRHSRNARLCLLLGMLGLSLALWLGQPGGTTSTPAVATADR